MTSPLGVTGIKAIVGAAISGCGADLPTIGATSTVDGGSDAGEVEAGSDVDVVVEAASRAAEAASLLASKDAAEGDTASTLTASLRLDVMLSTLLLSRVSSVGSTAEMIGDGVDIVVVVAAARFPLVASQSVRGGGA